MSAQRRPRRWWLLRGLVAAGAVFGLFVAVGILVLTAWARTERGRGWIRDQLVTLAAPPHGSLTAGALETDLFSWAVLRDVTLAGPDGARVAHVDTLTLGYRLGGLSARRLVVPEARVEGLDVVLTETDAGIDLVTMWDDGGPPSTEPWGGLPVDIVAAVEVVDANVRYVRADGAYGVTGARARADVELRGPAVLVRDLELSAPATLPDLGPLALAGTGRWDPSTLWFERLDLALGPNRVALTGGLGRLGADATVGVGITALHVEPASLAALAELPVTGAFDATGGVAGLLVAPTLVLEVATPGGPLHATAALDRRGARPAWSASFAPSDVALHTFLPDVPPTIVRGGVTVEGQGLRWPDDLDATAVLSLEAPRLGELTDLAVSGTARLSKGVLDLEGLRASAPGARVRGDGVVRLLEQRGEVRIAAASADLALLRRFGVPEARGRAGFSGTARFGWGASPAVHAAGALEGAAIAWADLGGATTVDGPVTVDWSPDGGVAAAGVLALTGLTGPDVRADSATLDGTVAVAPDGALDVAADARIAGLVGPGVTGDAVSGPVTLTRTARGRLDARADLVTTRLSWEGWTSDAGTARLHLDGDTATVTVDLRDGPRTMVGLEGEVDLAARSVRARRVEVAPTEDLAWRSEGVQTVRLVDGGVADVRLRFTSGGSLLSVEGHGAKEELVDLRVEARDVRLDRLAALLPARFAGYGGRVTLRASMEGHASRPALYVDLDAEDLTVPDVVQRLDVDLQGVGGDRRLRVEGRIGTGAQRLARLVGDLPFSLAIDDPGLLSAGDLDVRLLVPPSSSESWSAILPEAGLPAFRGSAEIALTGPVLDPGLSVVGIVDAPVGQRGEWLRVDLDARTTDGLLTLRAVARERLERRLKVDGTLALHLGAVAKGLLGQGPPRDLSDPASWAGAVALDIVPLRLPVEALGAFVDLPASLTGDLSGGLQLTGTVRAPRVEGALFLQGGHLGDLSISPALVSLVAAEGGYRVDGNVGFGNQGAVTVGGFVPFAPTLDGDLAAELARPGLDLAVAGDAIPLTAVAAAWPRLDATAGSITIHGTVTGSVADPAPNLDFGLAGGDFVLRDTGVRYAEAAFTGHLDRDELRVSGLTLRTLRPAGDLLEAAGGSISGEVVARRVDDRPVFDGSVTLDRAWILDRPEQILRLDGKLRLGDRGGKLRATGRLALVDGSLVVPERFFAGTSDLALASDVRVLRRGEAAREATREEAEGLVFPGWLDAEVSVSLDRNAFLTAAMPMEQVLGRGFSAFSSIELFTQLDGELKATVVDGELSLVGEVRPLRGTARVFSRPFDVTGNSIFFTGRDYTEPVLDLVAVHENAEYGPITTRIGGTPSTLELSFSAEESGLAQEDVLSVLVLGRPSSELAAGEGQAIAGLGDLLVSGVLSAVNQQAASGVGLVDIFELDATSLRVGRRFRDETFFKTDFLVVGEWDWTADPAEENIGEVTLEWQVGRFWQVDLTTGTQGFSSLSWNRKWRF